MRFIAWFALDVLSVRTNISINKYNNENNNLGEHSVRACMWTVQSDLTICEHHHQICFCGYYVFGALVSVLFLNSLCMWALSEQSFGSYIQLAFWC